MFRIPYEQIVQRIKEEAGISEQEIDSRVKEKLTQLSGLISKEGAATIIANELGVKLVEKFSGKLQIKNVLGGMRSVELVGKVIQVYDVREFEGKNGPGKVGSFVIGDETGTIRVALWGSQSDMLARISAGSIVRIKDAYTRENNGRKEVHLNDKSQLEINPEGVTITSVASSERPQSVRKKIEELADNDDNIELLGTIVQVFDPRFYEVCPECSKRIRQRGEVFVCEAHGEQHPAYGYLVNLFLDDGSQNIRTIFFKNQAEHLLSMNSEQMLQYRDHPQDFDAIKKQLLGTIIKVTGRCSKNQMFDRLEFVAQFVDPNPNPAEELKRLEAQK